MSSANLRVVPRPKINQEDLRAFGGKRNEARRLVNELRAESLRIFEALTQNTPVESGVHMAEIEEVPNLGTVTRRLVVDGRPVEDW